MSETTSQLVNMGVGKWRRGTLAELEADIARARAKGAPDDASVISRAPGSIYLAEIQWIQHGVPIWWSGK